MQNKLGEAQNFYRKALSLHPDHPDFLSNFANLKIRTGDIVGAQKMVKKALEIDSEHRNALQLLRDIERSSF